MKNETAMTAATNLATRANEIRQQREAAEARAAASRKACVRLVLGSLVAVPVASFGLLVAAAVALKPAPSPTGGPDWRAKVGQATPAELAAQPPLAKAAPEAKAAPAPKAEPEADRLAEWSVRLYEAEQAHQARCQAQLEVRGYGDASCYH